MKHFSDIGLKLDLEKITTNSSNLSLLSLGPVFCDYCDSNAIELCLGNQRIVSSVQEGSLDPSKANLCKKIDVNFLNLSWFSFKMFGMKAVELFLIRKSSCVTVRGILSAVKQVLALLFCHGRYPILTWLGGGVSYPNLAGGTQCRGALARDGVPFQKGPGASNLGKNLGLGYPPSPWSAVFRNNTCTMSSSCYVTIKLYPNFKDFVHSSHREFWKMRLKT